MILSLLLVAQKSIPSLGNEDYDYPAEDDSYDQYDDEEYGGEVGVSDDDLDVVVLTADNFAKLVLGETKYALVEFYAPWCGHCKELAPHYAAAATELKEYDSTIVIGKVDATVHTDLAQEYGVEGYPSLKWFKNGEPSEYGGGRTQEDIVKWVKKQTGPPSVLVASVEELKDLTDTEDVVVLGFFKELESAAFKSFEAAAAADDSVTFAHTTDSEVAQQAGVSQDSFVLIKDFDGGNKKYDGALTEEDVASFVMANKLPLIIPFSEKNAEKIFGSGIDYQVLLFVSSDTAEEDLALGSQAAAQLRGQVLFVSVNTDEEVSADILEFFGLKAMDYAQVMGFTSANQEGVKYRYSGDFTVEGIKGFAASMLAGDLMPDYKSEEAPAKNDLPVTVVTGNTFKEIVYAETKDVLLEVYAPWCGHCKELAPIYKKLGKRFKDVDSVVIAKMDGTLNEHPALAQLVEGFPTLLFFPAGENQEPIPIQDKTLKGLTAFIKKNAKIEFQLPSKKKIEEPAADLREEL
eukprot:CAMPEP_0196579442 /NCGR_PEP_ID=MMETSP1081-20130531/21998_1 /TAXON_ID=36882 /ORGANISM="Pyramimonas amylifera, Strain CCMP720" /LENGTH=518 /DNA_ID=CAMNT_0041899043 /DNA_START=154 /DNA_END=1710 /DNA_ORIENTATION=+